MQRTEDGGIIISCDFCGTDWDAYDPNFNLPMVEGHHGSVICLECVKQALNEMAPTPGEYRCTLCLREGLPPDRPRWTHPNPVPGAGLNVHAIACRGCIRQAARKFHKDPDIDWQWDEIRKDLRAGLEE